MFVCLYFSVFELWSSAGAKGLHALQSLVARIAELWFVVVFVVRVAANAKARSAAKLCC